MKLYIFIFFVSIFILKAKDSTLVKDEFLNNINSWQIFENDTAKSEISNSNLILSNKNKTPNFYYLREFNLNASKMDFQIDTKIKVLNCEESKGIGVILCKNGINQYLVFRLNKLNYYKLSYYNNGKYQDLIDYRKYDYILKEDKNINLKFICRINSLQVYINDNKVIDLNQIRLDGNEIGFVLPNDSRIAIQYFSVKLLNINKLKINNKLNSKENLGPIINSQYNESACLISPDGKTLYVTRKNHPQNMGGNNNDDDVWYSTLDSNGNWSYIKNIGKPINNYGYNNIISSSADNNTLYLLNNYNEKGEPNGQGISTTTKTENGWGMPKKVHIDSFVNNSVYSAFCFSTNQNILISSIEDDKSIGELDLYVSFKNDDGSFTKPKNLGKTINTKELDFNPFLASDNQTLYFSTLGRKGYGSADIYSSKRLDESWENWSEPENLGNEINSEFADLYYSIPVSGDYAYLVTDDKLENAQGLSDIVRIKIRDTQKPQATKLFTGKILMNDKPFATKIFFESLKDSSFNGFINTFPNTGEFKIALPIGDKYTFYYNDLNSKKRELDKIILLNENQIDTTKIYSFKNEKRIIEKYTILFKFNKYKISKKQVENLKDYLTTNNIKSLEILAHTDSIGTEKKNLKLSIKRAKSLEKIILKMNIKFLSLPKGESEPVKPNNTKEGRVYNRRVDLIKR